MERGMKGEEGEGIERGREAGAGRESMRTGTCWCHAFYLANVKSY